MALIHYLTDTDLIEEWRKWDTEIANAKSWGAALAAANEFRTECEQEIARRGLDKPINSKEVTTGHETE